MAISNAGGRVDRIMKLAAEIEKEDAALKKKKRKLAKMQDDLLGAMNREGMESVGGKLGTIKIRTTQFVEIVDWGKLQSYVKRTGNIDLFQRRINLGNFKELLDQPRTKAIPGLKMSSKRGLHRTKKKS